MLFMFFLLFLMCVLSKTKAYGSFEKQMFRPPKENGKLQAGD